MFRATFVRLSLGLVLLTCSILVGLDSLGLMPRLSNPAAESRVQLCESLALQTAMATDRNDYGSVRSLLDGAVRRNQLLLSAGLRTASGRLLVATAKHHQEWKPESHVGSTATHARIPLVRKGEQWATVEVRFVPPEELGVLAALWERPLIRMMLPVALLGFFAYALYLKRTLKHLDPSAVIPKRVQAALDVMSEGVLLLDQDEQIVLVNSAFAKRLGRPSHAFLGVRASEFEWRVPGTREPPAELPWIKTIRDSKVETGVPLSITTNAEMPQTYMVNSAPVGDEKGKTRGAIVTFDDISELERKSAELERALTQLEKSRDETRLQNEELQILARTDPLTGLANRRSFMDVGETTVKRAMQNAGSSCCLMVDIDRFKAVNDKHGHVVGDVVIRAVAEALGQGMIDRDLVCRYGGEEFCLLLPNHSVDETVAIAERVRRKIARPGFAPIGVTASFGVASLQDGAATLYDLIEQADMALYASKQGGRNRVTRWDQLP